jgi:hypothetical protein
MMKSGARTLLLAYYYLHVKATVANCSLGRFGQLGDVSDDEVRGTWYLYIN